MAGPGRLSFQTASTMQFVFACLAFAFCLIFIVPSIVTATYEYTAFRGSVPGTVTSERWNTDYWFTLTLALYFYLPFGMLYTIIFYKRRGAHIAHVVLLCLIGVHQVIGFGFFARSYSLANNVNVDNVRNPANSVFYCCVSEVYDLVGNGCIKQGPCTPGVMKDQLQPDPAFSWKLWTDLVALIIWIIHIPVYFRVYLPATETSLAEDQETDTPLLEDGESQDLESNISTKKKKIRSFEGRNGNKK